MHSVFAESKNLSQVKDSNNQIHTIQSYIAERYLVLIHSWRVYAILLLCWDTRCLITMLSYTQQKYIVVVYSTLVHCWNTPITNIAEVDPIILHCWVSADFKALMSYSES